MCTGTPDVPSVAAGPRWRDGYRFRTVCRAKLGEYRGKVFLYAVLAYVKQFGDVGVGESSHDGMEHLRLSRRKVRYGRILRELSCYLRCDHATSGRHRSDGRDELRELRALHERPRRAGRKRVRDSVRCAVEREDHDLGAWKLAVNFCRRRNTVHLRHHEIHDDHVRGELDSLAHDDLAVFGLAYDFNVVLRAKERRQPHAFGTAGSRAAKLMP